MFPFFLAVSSSFLSTPSVGRATTHIANVYALQTISIHALRGEGDIGMFDAKQCAKVISIHALRGEGDRSHNRSISRYGEFLSTPSVGRATQWGRLQFDGSLYFYPRPPWGGRQIYTFSSFSLSYFYPRPPWGGRRFPFLIRSIGILFLSTPSVGRATGGIVVFLLSRFISIHALRGEGDSKSA